MRGKWVTIRSLIILLIFIFAGISAFTCDSTSNHIVSTWVSKDGRAKIAIYRKGATFSGRIVWLDHPYRADGTLKTDQMNPDESLRNRPLIGLEILHDFEYAGDNTWEDGEIYDPEHGKTYSSKMTLVDYNQLEVRGYIGIPMFGRSEVVLRDR
jgi:uncharacterized protein (DUF2147 family)